MKTVAIATAASVLLYGATAGFLAGCAFDVVPPQGAQEHFGLSPEPRPLDEAVRELETLKTLHTLHLAHYEDAIAQKISERDAVNAALFGLLDEVRPFVDGVSASLGPAGAPLAGVLALGLPFLAGLGIRRPGDISRKALTAPTIPPAAQQPSSPVTTA